MKTTRTRKGRNYEDTFIHPREVFQRAILAGSVAIAVPTTIPQAISRRVPKTTK
ncbi:MAG: hypothetical protein WKF77_08410 [Planctomycetaceae bacterium]